MEQISFALHLAGGQGEGLAGFQHLDAVLELLQADLGAFGVQQGSNGLVQLSADSLQHVQTALVLLVGAVGKVEAGHVHAVGDQLAQDAVLIGRRAKGADDFRFSHKYTSNSLFFLYDGRAGARYALRPLAGHRPGQVCLKTLPFYIITACVQESKKKFGKENLKFS